MRKGRIARWALAGASVAALTATSVAGAGHDGSNVFHLGEINTYAGAHVERAEDGVAIGYFEQEAATNTGIGVRGVHANVAGDGPGVLGETNSTSTNAAGVLGRVNPTAAGGFSAGVRGINNGTGGVGAGVIGQHAGTGAAVFGTTVYGTGVFGEHTSGFGGLPGVLGRTGSLESHASGVKGVADDEFGAAHGVWGESSGRGAGVYGTARRVGVYGVQGGGTGPGPFYGVEGVSGSGAADSAGVRGRIDSNSTNAAGVRGENTRSSCCGMGVLGLHHGAGYGVYGQSVAGTGVLGQSNSDAVNAAGVQGVMQGTGAAAGSAGVYGTHEGTGALGIGVRGHHAGGGNGVYGSVQNAVVNAAGVLGQVLSTGAGGVGVYGAHSGSGYGVYGNAFGAGGAGVVGQAPASSGWAGYFTGNVHVTGALSKGGGAFKIDHPLDPANKYLQHSFVESPDMKNVYDGVVQTDAKGFATVRLPSYFQALNRDFRYQLTIIGATGWRARVVEKIRDNRFKIQTDEPAVEVSWQVTGIRKDRWANANRIQAEQTKPAAERGRYLNPELYGVSKAKGMLRMPPAPRRLPAE